jgi:oligopeptide/dipeptide ABC transporter ATP-binding protein
VVKRNRIRKGEKMALLDIQGLKTYFFTAKGIVRAVDGVDINLESGKKEGLVGESGCGKSITALSIMQLVPPPGRIVDGKIVFEGEDLLQKRPSEMSRIRGRKIAMVFQEPLSSLNPVLQIGEQVEEAIRLHQGLGHLEARKKVLKILELVGIPSPSSRIREYPHQLSGGMRQRVMIAMALSCNPSLLIADEPTTALDVTIQAQILELLQELSREFNTALLLITHDLGVVAEICDRVTVMYAGNVIERASTRAIFKKPRHPYTKGLLNSIPRVDIDVERLKSVEGVVPNLLYPPGGCRFNPRCPDHKEICHKEKPVTVEVEPEHYVSCWMYSGRWQSYAR